MLEKGNFAYVEYIDDIVSEDKKETNESIEIKEDEIDVSIHLEYEEYIKEYILKQKYDNDKFKNGILAEYDEIVRIFNENYKSKTDK